jgi:hypothetical protein
MTDPDAPDPRYLRNLLEILQQATQSVRAKVIAPRGRSDESRAWNKARATDVGNQIARQIEQARRQLQRWTGAAVTASARSGSLAARRQLAELLKEPSKRDFRDFNLVNFDVVKALVEDTYKDLDQALSATQQSAQRTLRAMAQNGLSDKDVNQILAGSVIAGNAREGHAELRRQLQQIHGEEIVFPSGHTMQTRAYATMVARTRLREAHVVARHRQLRRDGVDHVVIIGNRTKYPCTGYLGKIYYIGTGADPAGYPNLAGLDGPPFHPNCSKTTAPIVLDLATKEQLALGREDAVSRKIAELGADTHAALTFFNGDQVQKQVEHREKTIAASIGRKQRKE